jgi:hypothetical protein
MIHPISPDGFNGRDVTASLEYRRNQAQYKAEGYPKPEHTEIPPTMDKRFH